MKILVPVKRVVDAYVTIRVKSDGSGVDTNNVKMSLNPFCEIALEEAIRLKESGAASEVVMVSVGSADIESVIRSGLAMGADRAIRIDAEDDLEPLAIAKILKSVVEKEEPGMVICGKQSIDGDNNQTGQMLSALLDFIASGCDNRSTIKRASLSNPAEHYEGKEKAVGCSGSCRYRRGCG